MIKQFGDRLISILHNPLHLPDLRKIAKEMGIRPHNKTKEILLSQIKLREHNNDENEEKEYKEEEEGVIPEEFETFNPRITKNSKFHKMTIALHNLPVNAKIISSILNWAQRANFDELTVGQEDKVLHITITAMATAVGYGITNEKKRSRYDYPTNMMPLSIDILNGKISVSQVRNWLTLNDEHYQKMLEKSDMYADIEELTLMNINYKMIEVAGAGLIELKEPNKFPSIFCPKTKQDCFFLCSEEAGLIFKEGITLHQIEQSLKIGASVPISKIGKIIEHFSNPIQVVIHKVKKDGRFTKKKSECSRIPHEPQGERTLLHLGNISGHFFLIKGTEDLDELSAEDFKIFKSENDKFLNELDTTRPPIVHLMEKVAGKTLWEGKSTNDAPIPDEAIQKRIISYKIQDRKAKREVCGLSIQEVRNLLSLTKCFKCKKIITRDNWSLDRKDNSKGHSASNLRLCCQICNKKKNDNEQIIFTWDLETFPEISLEMVHVIYAVGITEYDIDDLESENYQNIYDNTEIAYGEDYLELLEDWLLDTSEEIKEKVDERLNDWKDKYMEKNLERDKKKLKDSFDIKISKSKNPEKLQKQCQKELDELLEKMTKMKRSKLTKNLRIILYAHFGSKFDNQFIFKSKRLQFEFIIDSFGLIQMVLKGGYIEFRDTARITGLTSLAKLCKDFKLPQKFSKTNFPHEFVNKNTLNSIGTCPEEKYWKDGKIPEDDKGKDFDLKKTSIDYLKLDCVSP